MASRDLDTEALKVSQRCHSTNHDGIAADYDPDIVFQVDEKKAKEWHRQSDLEFRAILVQQCLQTLLGTSDIPDLDDSRVRASFQLIRKMEFVLFLTANNRGGILSFWMCTLRNTFH